MQPGDALRLWHAMDFLRKSQLPYRIDVVPDMPGKFRIEIKVDHGAELYDGTFDAAKTMLLEVARKKVEAYLEKTQKKFDEYKEEIENLRTAFGWIEGEDDERTSG